MPRHRSSSRHPASGRRSAGSGTLRLIGGEYRGRRLPIAELDGLRPTGDRQRETLFNWLQVDIPGARVADLFAGTGALGLEAASRGAAHVWLIERHSRAVRALRESVGLLGCDAEVVAGDALAWLATVPARSLDGVFIDPPFAADLWSSVFDRLRDVEALKPGAFVYVEAPRDKTLAFPADWSVDKEKPSGEVVQRVLRTPR